jgi:hypothetical protein
VDRLTKAAHFIPVKTTYNCVVLVELYMYRIVCLHGVPKKIVSDRGTQILEDMLRACALQDKIGWDKRLPYAEFSYNNSYQASLKMSPFEALYGRNSKTPLHWDQLSERQVSGPDVLLEVEENIRMVRENLKAAQSRQ